MSPSTMIWAALGVLLILMVQCACSPDPSALLEGEPSGPRAMPSISPDFCPRSTESITSIRFGATPAMGPDQVLQEFKDTASIVSRRLGIPVHSINIQNYSDLTIMLENKELDVASLSPLAYVQARESMPCLKLLATQISNGDIKYSGYLLVHKESEIQDLADIRGKKIGFVSPSSASGFLFPMATLVKSGLSAREILDHSVFLGDHPNVVEAVVNREVDVGATFYGAFSAARFKRVDTGDLRVLAITGRMPYDAIVARQDLPDDLAEKIRDAFLDVNTTNREGRWALAHWADININGWIPTNDQFYDSIRGPLKIVREATGGTLP